MAKKTIPSLLQVLIKRLHQSTVRSFSNNPCWAPTKSITLSSRPIIAKHMFVIFAEVLLVAAVHVRNLGKHVTTALVCRSCLPAILGVRLVVSIKVSEHCVQRLCKTRVQALLQLIPALHY